MPSKLLTIKAAAAALVAVLSIGGVAAATGLLPGQAEQAAEQAASTTGASPAGHDLGKAAVADLDKATQGLCQAWQAGKGDSGSQADAPAFQALTAAAGGTNKIAAYCADVTAGESGEHGQGRGSAVGPDATAVARLQAPALAGTGRADPRPPPAASLGRQVRDHPALGRRVRAAAVRRAGRRATDRLGPVQPRRPRLGTGAWGEDRSRPGRQQVRPTSPGNRAPGAGQGIKTALPLLPWV